MPEAKLALATLLIGICWVKARCPKQSWRFLNASKARQLREIERCPKQSWLYLYDSAVPEAKLATVETSAVPEAKLALVTLSIGIYRMIARCPKQSCRYLNASKARQLREIEWCPKQS